LFGDYPYLTAEGAVLHCALDASKERREKRKKPSSAFSAQSSAAGLHWACSAVKGNGVEKPASNLWVITRFLDTTRKTRYNIHVGIYNVG
jgi:hypothetical protein